MSSERELAAGAGLDGPWDSRQLQRFRLQGEEPWSGEGQCDLGDDQIAEDPGGEPNRLRQDADGDGAQREEKAKIGDENHHHRDEDLVAVEAVADVLDEDDSRGEEEGVRAERQGSSGIVEETGAEGAEECLTTTEAERRKADEQTAEEQRDAPRTQFVIGLGNENPEKKLGEKEDGRAAHVIIRLIRALRNEDRHLGQFGQTVVESDLPGFEEAVGAGLQSDDLTDEQTCGKDSAKPRGHDAPG